jgi:hypothetical protein
LLDARGASEQPPILTNASLNASTAGADFSMPSPETSRRNLEKARAKWRPPRPWRSTQESIVIKRLACQWFMDEEPRCSLRELARRLGVSHTYIQKLVREFAAEPSKMLSQTSRPVRGFGMASISANGRMQIPYERHSATFEQLDEAQAMSRKMRERGWLRSRSRRELRRGPGLLS